MAKKEIIPVVQTKSQIVAAIAEKVGITKAQAKDAIDYLVVLAYAGAKADAKGFTVPGLGKLVIKDRAARTVRNPQTGDAIKKPACKVAKFRLAKAAKDALVPPKKK